MKNISIVTTIIIGCVASVPEQKNTDEFEGPSVKFSPWNQGKPIHLMDKNPARPMERMN